MEIIPLMLAEFEEETRVTRTVLERVPDEGEMGAWKPHEKAFAMAHLAQLVGMLPGWVAIVTEKDEFDIAPKDGPKTAGYSIQKTAALLDMFDKNVTQGREALGRLTEAQLEQPWHFKARGVTMRTYTKYEALRSTVFNHLVHHRAQLGLYLRMTDKKVPQMYGPTADDKPRPAPI